MMKKIMLLNAMLVGCVALQADMQSSKELQPEKLYDVSALANNDSKISNEEVAALHRAVGQIATRTATDEFCQKQQNSYEACIPFTKANALKATCIQRQNDYKKLDIKYSTKGSKDTMLITAISSDHTSGKKVIDLADELDLHINEGGDNMGKTALMMAVMREWYDAAFIQKMINLGADVNIRDHDGKTALAIAKARFSDNPTLKRYVDVIKTLEAAGAK